MRPHEWLAPVLVGVFVAAALWALEPGPGDTDGGPDETGLPLGTLTPFAAPSRLPADILVVHVGGRLEAGMTAQPEGAGARTTLGDGTAFVRIGHVEPLCGDRPCDVSWAHGAGPRLLEGNHTLARLTVYAFDGEGVLLATNAPPAERDRFDEPSFLLPDDPWHLGDGAAPAGSQALTGPAGALLAQRLPLLEGLPAGGVASTVVGDHPYRNLVGPVWVTVRVDAVLEP